MPQKVLRFRWIGLMALVLAVGTRQASWAADSPVHGPRVVMIIRHAEKPDEADGKKDPNLSKRGVERAQALAKVIPEHFPKPDFLIAAKRSKGSNRPGETIAPLAKALDEKVESKFKDSEFDGLAQAVLTDPKYAGKVVLIAWHHKEIPGLAKALGVKDVPDKWKSKVFDRVWEITYENDVATLEDRPQNALPGDTEK